MKTPAGLLDLPADRGARQLALGFLHDAATAHARLEKGGDDEALHDFRVGLRRLRSTVRAYADHLGDSVAGKDRRRLAALADATGDARDVEVHAAWVDSKLASLDEDARARAEELLADFRGEQSKADEQLRREVSKDFGRVRWRLARRLRFYRIEVDLDEPAGGPRLASVLARLALEASGALQRRLDAVESIDDQDEAHRARIAAKRLRYLVEPFAGELEGAPALVKRLKRLQDALGEMHDAHVLLQRLPDPPAEPADDDPGAQSLRAAIEAERAECYAAVEPEWVLGKGADFFARMRELAQAVRARGAADQEIERKYLLKRMPAIRRLDARIQDIDQGWLPGERLAERIRRVREDGQDRYYRTVKMGRGLTRTEVEEETSETVFRRMWPLTRGKRVRKRRYVVEDGDYKWEIDRFRDRRLVLCEVELPSEDADPPLPAWLRRELVRDVTGEDEYVNLNLAK